MCGKLKSFFDIRGSPKKINKEDIKLADLIVIIADNVDKKLFDNFKGNIIKWNVRDTSAENVEEIREIVEEIEEEVKKLIINLNKKI